MEVKIDIKVVGDCWHNQGEVVEQLKRVQPTDIVILDLQSEGPSLHRTGVVSVVCSYVQSDHVLVTKWSNPCESVPFGKLLCGARSHFWRYSKNYWTAVETSTVPAKFNFGLFLGRNTIARNCILFDCEHRWPGKFLSSRMKNNVSDHWAIKPGDLETIEQWTTVQDRPQIQSWISSNPVPSIDDKNVRDQYHVPEQSSVDCNQSLLRYYNQFDVEIVCETYTLGDTFFPTEKTVRPIMAAKPLLVYGPRNFLARLRDLGFKTYNEHWDESYDKLEGPERWHAMRTVIDDIMINQKYLAGQNIALQNRQRLWDMITYDR